MENEPWSMPAPILGGAWSAKASPSIYLLNAFYALTEFYVPILAGGTPPLADKHRGIDGIVG
ncbi:MAG TPA: hypothetical protein VN699_09610 [Pirellulales bacterium]|nr:hypothetical protein [Pirellulales bacterium]